MITPQLQFLAQVFTERLLNTAAEGALFAALAWLLLRLVGRQNSGTRFAVWLSALAAIVALPFVTGSGGAAPSYSRVLPLPPLPRFHTEINLSSSWASYLLAAWTAGAGLLLFRLIAGLWRLRHFRRNCTDLDLARFDPAIAGIVRDFSTHRRVKLCVSIEATAPVVIGFFHPAIVFPACLVPQLSAEEIKLVLLHELAHLRRWDDWTNLAQKMVRALFFFHPAVWWIENRLTLEREMACDDMVLAQTASPRAYASSLISFAEKLYSARGLALAQALVSRMRHTSLRVAQILDARRPIHTQLWKPALVLGIAVFTLVLGAAPYSPRLVTFHTQERVPHSMPVQVDARLASPEIQTPATAVGTDKIPAVMATSRPTSAATQPRVIPAAFHPRTARVRRKAKAMPGRNPPVMRAETQESIPPVGVSFVIVETGRYDDFGSTVWTLCVWKVGGGDRAEKQLQSAIVLSLI